MHRNEQQAEEIIEIARRLHLRNMLAAGDGNISVKISPNEIMITPTGVAKAFIKSDEMSIVSLDNIVLKGQASTERLMHLEVYKRCLGAKAVVHAHPPTAIAWSIAKPKLKKLPSESLSEVILACGDIPFVPYARPGSQEMGEALIPYLPSHRALILSRHGALTWGESLEEAWKGMERIEHSAEILFRAYQLGDLTSLPKKEINFLREMRKKIGEKLL